MSFKGYKYLSLFIFYVFEFTFFFILVSLMKARLCCISKHGSMNLKHFCFYSALKYMTGAINDHLPVDYSYHVMLLESLISNKDTVTIRDVYNTAGGVLLQ